MPRLRSLPCTGAGILLLTLHLSLGAAESPRATLHATIERLILVFQDPALQGNDHHQERMEKVREIVRPQFAFREMAQQALGTHWRDCTEAEQREFVRLFTALLEQVYSDILERSAAKMEVLFTQERLQGAVAEVDTQVRAAPHEQPVAITYRLREVGEKWLVDDVVIERVSLVQNYRAQFRRLLRTGSCANLVPELEGKQRELEGEATPP